MPTPSRKPQPRRALNVRIRVDFSERCAVGPGKIALLEAIERAGSLSVAAQQLGMSYRRAWLLLDDLNHAFEEPVAITAVGGTHGGGARVTEYGRTLIRDFRGLEQETRKLAERHLRAFRAGTAARGTAPRRVSRATRSRAATG